MNIVFLYLYLLAAIVIGCLCIRKIKTAADYYVAGRKASTVQITGSLLATILGSSAILGSIDFAYAKGWAGAWFMLCGAFGLSILFFLVKPLAKFKGYNLPALLGNFYGEGVKKLSGGVIAIAWLGVIAAQIIGAAKITTAVIDISYPHAALAIGLTLTFYTALGGQLSIIKTDILQVILIIAGLVFVTIASLMGSHCAAIDAAPMISEKFSWMDLVIMLFTYSSTYVVGPDIYSRLFCAKDEKIARKAIVASVALLVPIAFMLAFIGIHGAKFHVDSNESVFFIIIKHDLPLFIVPLYFSILSAIMSSADTTLFTAAELLSQFAHDELDSKKSVRLTMACTFLLGVLSILIALKFNSILKVLLMSLGTYAGAFVIPAVWGLLGQESRRPFVVAAIVVGGSMTLLGKFLAGNAGHAVILLAFAVNLALLGLGRTRPRPTADHEP
ncbi:MAG: sodium:solute symporter family protein [Victivallales bacterium]|nr:sodium:solute symporter family protein [Victivallales bacterium]